MTVEAIIESQGQVKAKSIRALFCNIQNATVALLSNLADKLRKERRVKIGWVCCKVVEKEEERCSMFWGVGHLAANCKGVDKCKRCFNCGEKGHLKA